MGLGSLINLVLSYQVFRAIMALRGHSPRPSTLLPRTWELEPLEQRLKQVAASLAQVEHALQRKEDTGLRALLEQARKAEQNAWQLLVSAQKGIAPRSAVKRRIDKAHETAGPPRKRRTEQVRGSFFTAAAGCSAM